MYSKRKLSKPHVPPSTKSSRINRSVKIPINPRTVGIGGELGVPCTTNRLYGGLKALGRRERLCGFYTRTLMSRPYMTRVSWTVSGGKREMNNWGIRSGRERSSPTRSHGCCGVAGWRKCVGFATEDERPPKEFPLRCQILRHKSILGQPFLVCRVDCQQNFVLVWVV